MWFISTDPTRSPSTTTSYVPRRASAPIALCVNFSVAGSEHDGGHLTVADLDRERIIRKPVLGGPINEYARAA